MGGWGVEPAIWGIDLSILGGLGAKKFPLLKRLTKFEEKRYG